MLPVTPPKSSPFLWSCLCGIALHASSAAQTPALAVYPDMVYAKTPQRELRMDLFVPKAVSQPPLVVYIHGGGWKAGSRKVPFAKSLTAHGFAVASIDYRFSHQAKFPAQIHDCKGAVRWLRSNAEKYGYDAARIAAMGESAGGQLAVLLGTSGGVKELEGDVGGNPGESSRVQLVVDYFGATDFPLRARTQPAMTEKPGAVAYELFGGPVTRKKNLARLASGALFVTKDDPPLLAVHGDADQQVLPDQSERIVEAYKKTGLNAELFVVPGGGHSGELYHQGEVKDTVVRFLQKHLGAADLPQAKRDPSPRPGSAL